jgi:hypothetical protein
MSVTKMLVWVCLPNEQFHFWHLSIFEDIKNTLGTTEKDINACPEVQIEESNIPLKNREEDKYNGISPSRVVVVNAPHQ